MREAGGGSIVNMASEVAFSGSPGLAHYVTSKAAIIGLTLVLARELGTSQIRVNALAPGFIPTEGSTTMTATAEYDVGPTPLGRLGRRGRPARRARLPGLRRERVHHGPDAARQRRRLSHDGRAFRSPEWGDAGMTGASQTRLPGEPGKRVYGR